jgi:hypothetical protein
LDTDSKKTNSVSKKMGRPSLYQPEYCQMLIDHMDEGLSFESFAGVIDVCTDTLYKWSDEDCEQFHEDFFEAKKCAFAKNLLWWEREGIRGLWSSREGSFNSSNYIFQMKNRHKWRDKQPDEEIKTIMQPFIIEAPIAGKRFEIKTDLKEKSNGTREETART